MIRYTKQYPGYTIVYCKVFGDNYLRNIKPLRLTGHGRVDFTSDVIALIYFDPRSSVGIDMVLVERIVARSPRLRRLLYSLSLTFLKAAFRFRRTGLDAFARPTLRLSQCLFRTASSRIRRRYAAEPKMTSDSRFALRRLSLKLLIVLIFAGAQSPLPWGFGKALTMMLFMSAAISCALALMNHQRFRLGVLSYWDESLAFVPLGQTARMVFLR